MGVGANGENVKIGVSTIGIKVSKRIYRFNGVSQEILDNKKTWKRFKALMNKY